MRFVPNFTHEFVFECSCNMPVEKTAGFVSVGNGMVCLNTPYQLYVHSLTLALPMIGSIPCYHHREDTRQHGKPDALLEGIWFTHRYHRVGHGNSTSRWRNAEMDHHYL